LRRYEVESFLKSFGLFFALMAAIYVLFLYQTFSTRQHELDTRLLQQMRIFSFEPTTDEFDLEFVPAGDTIRMMTLYHGPESVYGYFALPTEDAYVMKVALPMAEYQRRVEAIRSDVRRGAVWYLLLIVGVSFLLAYYSLRPIREAMRMNKEFMRDIVHDVNTPIAAIAVNLGLLQKRCGDHKAIGRIRSSIETIGMLRENLHTYLDERTNTPELFDLRPLTEERLEVFRVMYPNLVFQNHLPSDIRCRSDRQAFVRILDNLIGNAAKYNTPGGEVTVRMEGDVLSISDTGRGIRRPDKAFERHYREGERGMGLGLHIVKQLCQRLGIGIRLESTEGIGTRVELQCRKVRVG